MAETIGVEDIYNNFKKKDFRSWTDHVSFLDILLIWLFVITIFGFTYYFAANEHSYLFYNSNKEVVKSITDSIYFSFVTATTTGFGDIAPIGLFKLFAVIEVVSLILMLALVTSKLISIKQDAILNEMYDLSFNEKVNRLRNSLLLFRQNLTRISSRIEENTIKKRETKEIYMFISSFEDILSETISLIQKPTNKQFAKRIDAVNTELIENSILSSFERLHELIALMNQNKLEWKRDVTIDLINKCLTLNEAILKIIADSKEFDEKRVDELKTLNSKIAATIKNELAVMMISNL
jgi:hypothetical protein